MYERLCEYEWGGSQLCVVCGVHIPEESFTRVLCVSVIPVNVSGRFTTKWNQSRDYTHKDLCGNVDFQLVCRELEILGSSVPVGFEILGFVFRFNETLKHDEFMHFVQQFTRKLQNEVKILENKKQNVDFGRHISTSNYLKHIGSGHEVCGYSCMCNDTLRFVDIHKAKELQISTQKESVCIDIHKDGCVCVVSDAAHAEAGYTTVRYNIEFQASLNVTDMDFLQQCGAYVTHTQGAGSVCVLVHGDTSAEMHTHTQKTRHAIIRCLMQWSQLIKIDKFLWIYSPLLKQMIPLKFACPVGSTCIHLFRIYSYMYAYIREIYIIYIYAHMVTVLYKFDVWQ